MNCQGLKTTKAGVHRFLKKYKNTGSMRVQPGLGRPSIITPEIQAIVDQEMEKDDETTATQLKQILTQKGYKISLSTVLRCRSKLGWTFKGSRYCQHVRPANKVKRLEWARKCIREKEMFDDVVFTDESSIQLETHRRFKFRRIGSQPKLKPR